MKYAIICTLMLSAAVWANIVMIEKLESKPTTFASTVRGDNGH